MENFRMIEDGEVPSLSRGSAKLRLVQAAGFAIALTLSGTGCSKDLCKGIPNGATALLPASDNESACFFKGNPYGYEGAQAFRQACMSQGRIPKRWWNKYPSSEAKPAHICLPVDTKSAWIPEGDENFVYNPK